VTIIRQDNKTNEGLRTANNPRKLFRLRRLPEHLRSRLNKRARPPLEQHWKWVDKKFMLIKKILGRFCNLQNRPFDARLLSIKIKNTYPKSTNNKAQAKLPAPLTQKTN
jgi:hypothetical protein